MNTVIQIIAKIYPDTFARKSGPLAAAGQTIVDKIKDNHGYVTKEEAKTFFDALRDSYNQGRSNKEQLRRRQQEDAAPVFDFLLHQGNTQAIEFYATKIVAP
jgi:hypothetical protein